MKKRILLINANIAKNPYPVPPIGICLIAERLKGTYEVIVCDGTFSDTNCLKKTVANFKPDYVGIGIRNIDDYSASDEDKRNGKDFFIPEIQRLFVKPLQEIFSGIIILGGAGFSIFPELLLDFLDADYGIVGEAEDAIFALLDSLDKGDKDPKIPGVLSRKRKHKKVQWEEKTGLVTHFSNIEEWVDYSGYNDRSAYPIQTKRGCPHSCMYCTYPLIDGNVYRVRTISAIVDEIEAVNNKGIDAFEIVDSIFNDPPGHAEAICKEIIKRNLKVKLRTMGMNPGWITDELIAIMKAAGFAQIDCTPDSASPEMIKNYRKPFTADQLITVAEILRRQEMPSMWFFILGGPGESVTTLSQTFDFIEQYILDLDLVYLLEGLRIYPGTLLYDIALSEDVLSKGVSLLKPVYYLSKDMQAGTLQALIRERATNHANWITSVESKPSAALKSQALVLRKELKTDEPMFRSLLRAKWARLKNVD